MKKNSLILFSLLLLFQCAHSPVENKNAKKEKKENRAISRQTGNTIETRFTPPDGYVRVEVSTGSFATYLRKLPLKPEGSKVHYYDGGTKEGQGVYCAVVDIDIGKYDLQQCADAVIRLRAEYLYSEKQYEKIHFNLTNGFRVDYSKWMDGNRVAVNGNNTSWVKKHNASNTYKDFRSYLDFVFSYAGTLSLSKELIPVKLIDMQIGDVLIRGGSPGHAVLVVDMAINPKNGEKVFMICQSYMPAQDIQILENPGFFKSGPWYQLDDHSSFITTPEWTFEAGELARFKGN